jgi:hypothetical protein
MSPSPRAERMTSGRGRLVLAGAAAAAALLLGANASGADAGVLYVDYTPACAFTLTDGTGAAVTSIPSGTYQLVVQTPFPFAEGDSAPMLPACDYVQFAITGPNVDFYTDLTVGDAAIEQDTITFQQNATYTAFDRGAPAATRKTFTTTTPGTLAGSGAVTTAAGAGGASSGASGSGSTQSALGTPLAQAPLRGTLLGSVSAAGTVTLTDKGKAVTTLRSGRYTVRVVDRSKHGGFTIQEIHKAAKTVSGVSYTGTRTVTLTLGDGQWFFYTTFLSKKTPFVVVP